MALYRNITLLFLFSVQIRSYAIKCFTCASTEYEPLFEHFTIFQHAAYIPRFGEFCDNLEQLKTFAPMTECVTTCITIMEPQYFGGVQSLHKPYTYIRGCAEKIFNSIENHSPEVHFLHLESTCLKLPLSQIWPSIQTDELVQICSCKSDACSMDIESISNSNSVFAGFSISIYSFLLLPLLNFNLFIIGLQF